MSRRISQAILDAEAAYNQASDEVTRICLEIEKECKHEIWCGEDTRYCDYGGSPLGGIYLCLHCRMEVHVRHANYASGRQKPPSDCLVLRPDQCGVTHYYQLRIAGDKRPHLHKEYSTFPGWPQREYDKELA